MTTSEDARVTAKNYVEEKQLGELFKELGSSLLYSRPDDIRGFLLQRLREILSKRMKDEHCSIFSDQDLITLFCMYDKESQREISKETATRALMALGVKDSQHIEIDSENVNVSAFVRISKSCLKNK